MAKKNDDLLILKLGMYKSNNILKEDVAVGYKKYGGIFETLLFFYSNLGKLLLAIIKNHSKVASTILRFPCP
jgi:hypothetical protein